MTEFARIATEVAFRQHLAFLCLNDDGVLLRAGGALAHYGFSDLRPGDQVLDQLDFLHGLVPLEGTDRLSLPFVRIGGSVSCSLDLSRDDGVTRVAIVDVAAAHGEQQSLQQHMHELRLDAYRKQDLIDQYLGEEIAARLTATLGGIAAGSERRRVTVLFADLRGFTSFCDGNDTADVFPILNRFLRAMIRPVLDAGGLVDKIIGDAVMAVFGLADDCPGRAERGAMTAAREMIARVAELSTGYGRSGDIEPVAGLGVGIATGDVVVGVLGTEQRRSFSVIGHRVNLASRLEGQARPGEILVDLPTFEALGDLTDGFRETDLVLKGLRRPVPAMSLDAGSLSRRPAPPVA